MAKSGNGGGNKLLVGGFVGLVIGILIAFGLVLYLNKATLPFQEKSSRPEHDEAAAAKGQALPLPAKPGEKPLDKPRFEFYKILPGTQEPTPGTAVSESGTAAAEGQPPAPTDLFYLQIGAFQKAADADNLKAKLALMGVEASVQDLTVPDKGILHRVRTGPYATPTEMNQARTLMAQNGVQATVIKLKDSGNQNAAAESKPGKQ